MVCKLSSVYLAVTCFASQAMASDFNLPFINSAGLGVAYADWASAANDASTAYANPAGLVNLPSQQLVINALGITGSAKFTGTSRTPAFPFPAPIIQSGAARSDIDAFLPSFYYAAPFAERFSAGLSLTTPFGLGTNYGSTAITRYAATRSQVVGIDASPSVAAKLTENFSVGAGFDALHLAFTLNNRYGPPLSFLGDTTLKNNLAGWGYGWHAGALFKISPQSRVGFSYNSRISLTTTGHSTLYLPIPDAEFRTDQQKNICFITSPGAIKCTA